MTLEATLREIATAQAGKAGALTSVLVEINRRFGHVPAAAYAIVADALNISEADVAGAVSFYADFRTSPPGRTTVKVCRAEACQAAGGEALAKHAETRVGCAFDATTADGSTTLEAIYCFGNCALAPAAAVNGRLLGRATPAGLDRAIAAADRT